MSVKGSGSSNDPYQLYVTSKSAQSGDKRIVKVKGHDKEVAIYTSVPKDQGETDFTLVNVIREGKREKSYYIANAVLKTLRPDTPSTTASSEELDQDNDSVFSGVIAHGGKSHSAPVPRLSTPRRLIRTLSSRIKRTFTPRSAVTTTSTPVTPGVASPFSGVSGAASPTPFSPKADDATIASPVPLMSATPAPPPPSLPNPTLAHFADNLETFCAESIPYQANALSILIVTNVHGPFDSYFLSEKILTRVFSTPHRKELVTSLLQLGQPVVEAALKEYDLTRENPKDRILVAEPSLPPSYIEAIGEFRDTFLSDTSPGILALKLRTLYSDHPSNGSHLAIRSLLNELNSLNTLKLHAVQSQFTALYPTLGHIFSGILLPSAPSGFDLFIDLDFEGFCDAAGVGTFDTKARDKLHQWTDQLFSGEHASAIKEAIDASYEKAQQLEVSITPTAPELPTTAPTESAPDLKTVEGVRAIRGMVPRVQLQYLAKEVFSLNENNISAEHGETLLPMMKESLAKLYKYVRGTKSEELWTRTVDQIHIVTNVAREVMEQLHAPSPVSVTSATLQTFLNTPEIGFEALFSIVFQESLLPEEHSEALGRIEKVIDALIEDPTAQKAARNKLEKLHRNYCERHGYSA